MKLLAWQARPGTTQHGSGSKAETYSLIPATNQHQLRQKMCQQNLQSFFVFIYFFLFKVLLIKKIPSGRFESVYLRHE